MDFFAVSTSELFMRIVFAMLLGIVAGAERSRVGKTAGMRTFALVSIGSALFTVMSGYIAVHYVKMYNFDPLRVLSQIVLGIGFLGAGVIFVERHVINGLTTAAGLWVVAGVGAAAGFGLYGLATFVTFLTLFIFEALWYLEERFVKKIHPATGARHGHSEVPQDQ